MPTLDLDTFDLRLLAALQERAGATHHELAETVGLSASQISRRRARLEEAGVIRGYRAVIDPQAVGLTVTAFVFVSLATHSPGNARRFKALVQGLSAVQEAHALTGDADYLVKLAVADLKALADLINDVLLAHETVARVRSAIVLETLKDDQRLPVG
jgi:DNA-binding Lrp family transcriptional regulator